MSGPRLSILFVLILTLMIAGCGRRDVARPPGAGPITQEYRQCLADLRAAGVRFTPLPDSFPGGGCAITGSVRLDDIGTPIGGLGAMTCPLARSFSGWVRYGAVPAARQYLGSEIVRVETFGSYACRNINGAQQGRRSEHAFANAVDVAAFVLKDGRRVSVLGGWTSADARERAFLRAVHASACRRFATVLSPDYNALHRDHFHLDMGRGPFCR